MRGKLTKRSVDALKTDKSGDVFLWDRELKGFGLRVKPSGARSFIVSYYAPALHRVRRRITLGAYGPMTVDEARDKATSILGRVAAGADPASELTEERRATKEETVERLLEDYLDYGRAHFKPRTLESYDYLSRLYVLPALGRLPVQQVSTLDIGRLHLELRKKPATANRVVQFIKAFVYWLEGRGLYSGRNPASGIELYTEKARERFLSVEELARIGQALRTAETVGLPPAPEHDKKPDRKGKKPAKKRARNSGMFTSEIGPASPVTVSALRFLMFTGWREQEALTLKWSDVNLTTGIATLGDTKSGKSVRAIGAPAIALLSAQAVVEGSPWVFPVEIQKTHLRAFIVSGLPFVTRPIWAGSDSMTFGTPSPHLPGGTAIRCSSLASSLVTRPHVPLSGTRTSRTTREG